MHACMHAPYKPAPDAVGTFFLLKHLLLHSRSHPQIEYVEDDDVIEEGSDMEDMEGYDDDEEGDEDDEEGGDQEDGSDDFEAGGSGSEDAEVGPSSSEEVSGAAAQLAAWLLPVAMRVLPVGGSGSGSGSTEVGPSSSEEVLRAAALHKQLDCFSWWLACAFCRRSRK